MEREDTRTRTKESQNKIATETQKNNLFCLCAWLAGVLYLIPSPNSAQIQERSSVAY